MSTPPVLPLPPKQFWEEGFIPAAIDKALIGQVSGALGQVVGGIGQVGGSVTPDFPTLPSVLQTIPVTSGIVPLPNQTVSSGWPNTTITVPSATTTTTAAPTGGTVTPVVTGDIVKDIENAALAAAKDSTKTLLPSLQSAVEAKVAGAVQNEVGALIKHLGASSEPPVPDLSDFTKADARSRAIRTLLAGLVLSALWGLVNVAGNMLTVDWTNKNALPQVLSMATTAVVGAVTAYISRMLKEPAHITNATIIPGTGSPG